MRKRIALCFLFALTACAGGDKPEPEGDLPPPKPDVKTEYLICPQVAILRQSDEVFDYAGEKRDEVNLVAKAHLKSVEGDCGYRKDEDDPTGIDIAFTLKAAASRGSRLGGSEFSIPYFIAVVDPSDNVLSRQVLTAKFEFSGDKQIAELEEPLHVFIPASVPDLASGPDYRVLLGFLKQRP